VGLIWGKENIMAGMERFTQRARRVLSFAHQEAERMHNNVIGTEHLLLGLMDEEGGVAGRVLRELGLTDKKIREAVGNVTNASTDFDPDHIELGIEMQRAMEYAVEEAHRLGHHYIGTEHILLGLVCVVNSVAMQVLGNLQINADTLRKHTRRVLNETAAKSSTSTTSSSTDKTLKRLNQIFILHGQDEQKKTVAALVQILGLIPVLMDEKNEDKTIVEYLDKHSNDVALAVIILAKNDPGIFQSDSKQPGWRVDHNFIYELGYFRGKLGRNRTCVLYLSDFQDEIELLSAFMGVIYIPLDVDGSWMTQLAKAIQDTGLETNLRNKL